MISSPTNSCKCHNFPFLYIQAWCINTHFLYHCVCWWASRLVPQLGCCEQCNTKCRCASISASCSESFRFMPRCGIAGSYCRSTWVSKGTSLLYLLHIMQPIAFRFGHFPREQILCLGLTLALPSLYSSFVSTLGLILYLFPPPRTFSTLLLRL